jgi:hypothetical protein
MHRAVLLGMVSLCALVRPVLAAGGSDDDAYYTKMQRELLTQSRATSTAAKEAELRQRARASTECDDLKKVSAEAGRRYAEVHTAPDPTKVIESNTCFIDVQSVQIPSTGFGFADQLLKNFMSSNLRNCPNGATSWTNVVNSVKTGTWKSDSTLQSIRTFAAQQPQNLTPQGNTIVGPSTSQPALPVDPTGLYRTVSPAVTSTPAQQSLADRLWSKFTGPSQ